MKRLILGILLLAVPALAQTPVQVERATLLSAYDLDGEAADDNQIVTSEAITDSNAFTVAANPDVCRKVDITVTDADSSLTAGDITVTGTDCFGNAQTATYTFATGGSAVYDLTVTGKPSVGAYFATVTDVDSGVLTGEGAGDLLEVGYTSNSENGWAMYGKRAPDLPGSISVVDPFGWYEGRSLVTTSGANSVTVTGVTAADDAFASPSAGDLIEFSISGTRLERKIATNADADTITVNAPVNIPAAGVRFRYKRQFFTTNPWDVAYVPVAGARTLMVDWSVDANASTGGVVALLECTAEKVEFPTARWVQIMTDTTATGSTQANTSESINLELLPYQYCRFGLKFGTGDDGDSADEDINLAVQLVR